MLEFREIADTMFRRVVQSSVRMASVEMTEGYGAVVRVTGVTVNPAGAAVEVIPQTLKITLEGVGDNECQYQPTGANRAETRMLFGDEAWANFYRGIEKEQKAGAVETIHYGADCTNTFTRVQK